MMQQNNAGLYDKAFFDRREQRAQRSASVVVPFVLELLPPISSVVDVGCGSGTWLAEFERRGISVIKGYDGGPPDLSQLQIKADCFERVDLTHLPVVGPRYDLAVCLEVGEHLPASSATKLTKFLADLSDVVLFSAALPGQGGVGHINEQPLSYWRSLFAEHGYVFYDAIRPQLWNDDRIAYWYRQNTVLAIKSGAPTPSGLRPIGGGDLVDVVHPDLIATLRTAEQKRRQRRLRQRLSRVVGRIRTILGGA